jgi:hypothetical protein
LQYDNTSPAKYSTRWVHQLMGRIPYLVWFEHTEGSLSGRIIIPRLHTTNFEMLHYGSFGYDCQ